MKELDRMIRRAGGVLVGMGRHRVYMLDGERISMHMGTHTCSRQVTSIKSQIRQILKRRKHSA